MTTRATVIAGMFGTLALAGCGGGDTANHIRIANASGGLNITMAALLKRLKYLEGFGLDPDVTAVSDGSKILGGIVGKSLDASFMSGFNQAFPAIARGADLRIIGGGAIKPVLALFTGKPDIRTIEDVEGRTVGTGSVGALTYQLTVTLLQKHGVDIRNVKFVSIGSSADVFRAVAQGTVDAGAGSSSLSATAATHGMRVLPGGNMAEALPEYTYQGAWASAATLAAKRDTIVKALAAYAKLFRYVQTPAAKDDFIAARTEAFPTAAPADHEAEWDWVQANKPFAVDLALSPERLAYIQQLNVDFGVQKAVLPFDRVADMSLAHDAVALLAKG